MIRLTIFALYLGSAFLIAVTGSDTVTFFGNDPTLSFRLGQLLVLLVPIEVSLGASILYQMQKAKLVQTFTEMSEREMHLVDLCHNYGLTRQDALRFYSQQRRAHQYIPGNSKFPAKVLIRPEAEEIDAFKRGISVADFYKGAGQ